jgi:hypothetical protein
MNRHQASIRQWTGAPPEVEYVESDGSLWYTRLTYRDQAGRRVDVSLLPKRDPRESAGGGTSATSSADSKRVAVTLAVDILYEAQPDPASFRSTATALLSEDDTSSDWCPAVLMVDGSARSGAMRTVGENSWAAVAELADHYLAVSGPTGWPMSALSFTVDTVTD